MTPTPDPLREALRDALAEALETHPDQVVDEAPALFAALATRGYTITLARPVRSPSLASIVQGRAICFDCGECGRLHAFTAALQWLEPLGDPA